MVLDLGGIETPMPVQFFHDLDGQVCAAEVPLEATVAPVRFTRMPDTAHLTDELLDRLAGRYELGPLTATVVRRGSGLVLRLVEGGYQELIPAGALVFRAGARRLEFTEDRRLITPVGEFTFAE